MSVVFMRSPKVMGSSVHRLLDQVLGREVWTTPMKRRPDEAAFRRHLDSKKVIVVWSGQVPWTLKVLGEELKKHQVVMPMRNPYARFISSWAYGKKQGWIGPKVNPMGVIRNKGRLNPTMEWHTFREQIGQLYCQNQRVPDLVMRTEHAQEDFATMCEMIGLPELELPKVNTSEHEPWMVYYDRFPNLRASVEKALPFDTKHLPYEFGFDKPTGPLPQTLVSS